MITTFFLTVLFSFLGLVLGLLPTGSLPTAITTSLEFIVGYMNTFNFFFPIQEIFVLLGVALLFELALQIFHFANWIYHKIRG